MLYSRISQSYVFWQSSVLLPVAFIRVCFFFAISNYKLRRNKNATCVLCVVTVFLQERESSRKEGKNENMVGSLFMLPVGQ